MQLKKYKSIYIKIILLILVALILVAYIYLDYIREMINILIISYILAYILTPIKKILIKNNRINDMTASLIIVLGAVAIIVVSFYIFVPRIFNEMNNLQLIIENITKYFDKLNDGNFKNNIIVEFIYNKTQEKGAIMLEDLSARVISSILAISEKFMTITVVPVVTYYFLSDSEFVKKRFYKLVPISKRKITRKILSDIDKLLGRYIIGQINLSLIVAVLTFLVLSLLKIKFSIGLSIFNGIFNIIPYFGAVFGMLPIIFVAFLDSPTTGIVVTILMIAIQQLEGNILSPRITGNSTDMHPLIIIILLLIGDGIGGFIGMILAVPIGVIFKVVYEDINYYLF